MFKTFHEMTQGDKVKTCQDIVQQIGDSCLCQDLAAVARQKWEVVRAVKVPELCKAVRKLLFAAE